MNRSLIIGAIAAGIALSVLVLLIASKVSRPVTCPSVTFLGYTNWNDRMVGAFKVTNADQGPANLYVDSMLWARARFSDPAKLRRWSSVRYYIIEALTNRQSVLVHLAPPTNELSWQTSFKLRELENQRLNDWRYNFGLPIRDDKIISIDSGVITANQSSEK